MIFPIRSAGRNEKTTDGPSGRSDGTAADVADDSNDDSNDGDCAITAPLHGGDAINVNCTPKEPPDDIAQWSLCLFSKRHPEIRMRHHQSSKGRVRDASIAHTTFATRSDTSP